MPLIVQFLVDWAIKSLPSQFGFSPLNERYTFVIAALVADLGASVLLYEIAPANPLCAVSPDLLSYAGQHISFACILWLLVLTGAWLYSGSQLVRIRQNLSTKLTLLVKLGVAGILIDNAVSIYLLSSALQGSPGTASASAVAPALAGRSILYVIGFSAVVLISFLISRNRKPIVTPPPRFGRE